MKRVFMLMVSLCVFLMGVCSCACAEMTGNKVITVNNYTADVPDDWFAYEDGALNPEDENEVIVIFLMDESDLDSLRTHDDQVILQSLVDDTSEDTNDFVYSFETYNNKLVCLMSFTEEGMLNEYAALVDGDYCVVVCYINADTADREASKNKLLSSFLTIKKDGIPMLSD